MHFLQLFFLLHLGYAFAEVYVRKPYQGQTTVDYDIASSAQYPLCKCAGGKCELDQQRADEVCKMLKLQFIEHTEPSPYFTICEFLPDSCSKAQSEPASHTLRLTVDQYYLSISKFFALPEQIQRMGLDMMQFNGRSAHPLFASRLRTKKVRNGETGFPVELVGVLSVEPAKFSLFKYCETAECRKWIDEFCAEFAAEMQKKAVDLTRFYLGCAIQHIYQADSGIQIAWSMQFQHRQIIEKGVVKTREDLQALITKATDGITSPRLKSYRVTGFRSLDVCEITATSKTIQDYTEGMGDVYSKQHALAAFEYEDALRKQIGYGDKNGTACLQEIVKFVTSNADGKLKFDFNLWVSQSCAKRHGLTGCPAITEHVKNLWTEGDKIWHNFWTPTYEISLKHTNKEFQ